MYFEIADKEYNGYEYQQVTKKDFIDVIEAVCRFSELRWFVLDMYDTTNIISKLAYICQHNGIYSFNFDEIEPFTEMNEELLCLLSDVRLFLYAGCYSEAEEQCIYSFSGQELLRSDLKNRTLEHFKSNGGNFLKNTFLIRDYKTDGTPCLVEVSGDEWKKIIIQNTLLPIEERRYFIADCIEESDYIDRMYMEVSFRSGECGDRIGEIDKQIAQLSAQNHVLAKLKNNGILGTAEYAEQSSEIENKIASLRTERRRRLSQSQDDEMLDELKTLNQIIDEYQPKAGFDKTLFEIIVKRIEVIDSTAIKFLLLGDIELTEEISKKARCAQREQKNDPIRL